MGPSGGRRGSSPRARLGGFAAAAVAAVRPLLPLGSLRSGALLAPPAAIVAALVFLAAGDPVGDAADGRAHALRQLPDNALVLLGFLPAAPALVVVIVAAAEDSARGLDALFGHLALGIVAD